MQKLTDGILLYHGNYMEVSNIDLSKCKHGLDFGHGFYLTSSYQQAYRYVPSSVRKAIIYRKVSCDFSIDDGRINNTSKQIYLIPIRCPELLHHSQKLFFFDNRKPLGFIP